MHAFIIELENRPGSLADVTEALADRGINITGVTGLAWGDDAALAIMTNDDAAARRVLEDRDEDYRSVELVAAALEDRPGTLAQAARRLADRGVNIEALFPTGMTGGGVTVAFAVDDPVGAREALGELAIAGASPV